MNLQSQIQQIAYALFLFSKCNGKCVIRQLMPQMRSARRASAQSAGCEARSAKQTVDTPHQRHCQGSEATSTTSSSRMQTGRILTYLKTVLKTENNQKPNRHSWSAFTALFCYVFNLHNLNCSMIEELFYTRYLNNCLFYFFIFFRVPYKPLHYTITSCKIT